ncbi:MAG: 2-dehydro-3-deoxyglucarate aldolase, partial [Chloroflexi bacterium]|nr:2-dehydro-3-deoxyglucarate aldolase [Chloroflexota bacterium]
MDVNPVKAKLNQKLPSLGTWSASGDPTVIEALLHTTDFDWVTLDFEHNPIDVSTAVNCLRAGNGSGKPMFARIPSNDPIWVKRVLDIGFTGIVVPDVKDEDEAERAVQAAKYRP